MKPIARYKVTIRGIRPLLMHRPPTPDEEAEEKRKKKGTTISPHAEAERALYKDEKGRICTPAIHIESALISSASEFPMPGKRRKSLKEVFLAGIYVEPKMIPHKYTDWVVDIQPVRIQKGRIMRGRPRFDRWELEFTINVMDERITEDVLKEVLQNAGISKGIGDYRPRYGLFEVVEFKEIKE